MAIASGLSMGCNGCDLTAIWSWSDSSYENNDFTALIISFGVIGLGIMGIGELIASPLLKNSRNGSGYHE